jgi:hypothetical protein
MFFGMTIAKFLEYGNLTYKQIFHLYVSLIPRRWPAWPGLEPQAITFQISCQEILALILNIFQIEQLYFFAALA